MTENNEDLQGEMLLEKDKVPVKKEDSNDIANGSVYYPIFKFLADSHNLILTDGEIQDLLDVVNKFYDEGEIQAILESTPIEEGKEAIENSKFVSIEEYENAVNTIGQLQEQLNQAEDEIRDLHRASNF